MAGRGLMRGLILLVVLALLLPSAARADDGVPKRLFARPDGVVTTVPVDAGTVKTRPFALGYNEVLKVTGTPPLNVDAAFVSKVALKLPRCDLERVCGGLAYVDCGHVDEGLGYYINGEAEIVGICGDVCKNGAAECKNCPPIDWTCGR